ncbi:MAG: hypothetical protein ABUL58_03495 [Steroidobacter sp.]
MSLMFLANAMAKSNFSDSDVQAAIAVLDAKHDIEQHYLFCRPRAGASSYQFDYIKYVWDLKNHSYIQESEQIFASLPSLSSKDIKERWNISSEKLLLERSNSKNSENGRYCSQYFSQLATDSIHELSRYRSNLALKLGAPEEVRIMDRNTDMEVGCIKSGYNKGIKQFEGIRMACSCQTSLIIKKLSNQEIDDYLNLIERSAFQDGEQFLGKKISFLDLKACYSNIAPN